MAINASRIIVATLLGQALLASGCSIGGQRVQSLISRGEMTREVLRKKAEIRADCRQAELEQKLAAQEDRLRQLESTSSTDLETTMAMEVNQSLEFDEITLDVEEMKRVIARAEARARAEQLRLKRRPQLLRDQEEALRQGTANVLNTAPDAQSGLVQPAQFSSGGQSGTEADMVVGIDEFGNPLPIRDVAPPQIAAWEIPLNMRVRLNLGVNNPRVQDMRLRRRPLHASPTRSRGCDNGCDGCDGCAQAAIADPHLEPLARSGWTDAIAAKTASRVEAIPTAAPRSSSASTAVQATGFDAEDTVLAEMFPLAKANAASVKQVRRLPPVTVQR